jgi:hypothetical protein
MHILKRYNNSLVKNNLDVKSVSLFSFLAFCLIGGSLLFFSFNLILGKEVQIKGLEIFSVTMMISVASIFVGMFLGFIFGIPRSHQDGTAYNGNLQEPEHSIKNLSVNTNLEQISDWLTKIIVGVGLVEIAKISDEFNKLVAFLSYGVGLKNKESIIFSLIIASVILGFLFGYLITRIYLTRAFSRVSEGSLDEKNKINKIEVSQEI